MVHSYDIKIIFSCVRYQSIQELPSVKFQVNMIQKLSIFLEGGPGEEESKYQVCVPFSLFAS